MEFTPGYAVDLVDVQDLCEQMQGRMADIILHVHVKGYSPKLLKSIQSEMNFYLAYIGHLRLDRWSPLPPPHPFTRKLADALHLGDENLLGELPGLKDFPSYTGQISHLPDDVFPKWWLDEDVASPAWKPFDLGGHICTYHAKLLEQELAFANASPEPLHQASEADGPRVARTAIEFREQVEEVHKQLETVESELVDIMNAVHGIWKEDLQFYREAEERLDSP